MNDHAFGHNLAISADMKTAISSLVEVSAAISWLQVLAVPHVFEQLKRQPPRTHLLRQVDVFLVYARSGACDTTPTFHPVPTAEREERALRLRALLERWTSRPLPHDITEAARDVLYAEGLLPPEGWDNLPDPGRAIDDLLVWPEKGG